MILVDYFIKSKGTKVKRYAISINVNYNLDESMVFHYKQMQSPEIVV